MPYDPNPYHRRSIRLKGYDYSLSGAYFVTICVHYGQCLLGEIVDDEIHPSSFGQIAADCWNDLPNHYRHMSLDAFIVMPNHVHGIVVLTDTPGGPITHPDQYNEAIPIEGGMDGAHASKRPPLSEIIRAFKTFSAKQINLQQKRTGTSFWQRNYYEHIIRNERSYFAIRDYIVNNPVNWNKDQLHPHAPSNRLNHHWR